MSTGLECLFFERRPNEWWYLLERWNAPKNAWDWREYADTFGSFPSFEEAHQHLSDHHANPGGYYTLRYEEGKDWSMFDKLIAEAQAEGDSRLDKLERHEWTQIAHGIWMRK